MKIINVLVMFLLLITAEARASPGGIETPSGSWVIVVNIPTTIGTLTIAPGEKYKFIYPHGKIDVDLGINMEVIVKGVKPGGPYELRVLIIPPNGIPAGAGSLQDTFWYPNPCRERRVIFTNLPAQVQIEIFNVAGERIGELEGKGPKLEWDCSKIASGVYIVYIRDLKGGGDKKGKLGIVK